MLNFLGSLIKGLIATFVAGIVTVSSVFVPKTTPPPSSNQVVAVQQPTPSSTVDKKIAELEKEIQDLKANQQQKPSGRQSNSSAQTISNLQDQVSQLKASVSSPVIQFINPAIIIASFPNVISINGSGFQSGSQIKIGNTDMSLSGTPTPTLILAKYAGDFNPGTYDVIVVNPDGGKFTLSSALITRPAASQTTSQNGTFLSAADVIQKVQPATVLITTDSGCGSGIIIQGDGTILTADHVISGASAINVYLSDGSVRVGSPIAENPGQDFALIKISGSGFTTANLGDSSSAFLPLGAGVIALGFPFCGTYSQTLDTEPGVITSRRTLSGNANLGELLQTNARINPGHSGGPLVDYYGNVVGINEAMAVDRMQSIFGANINITGIAYATPINAAKNFINNQSAFQSNQSQPSSPANPSQPPSGSVGTTSNTRQFTINGNGFCTNNPGVSAIILSCSSLVLDASIPAVYIQSWNNNQITFTAPDSVPAGMCWVTVRGYNKSSGYCSDVRVGAITVP